MRILKVLTLLIGISLLTVACGSGGGGGGGGDDGDDGGAGNTPYAWGVGFYEGYVTPIEKTESYYVRCVRGGIITTAVPDTGQTGDYTSTFGEDSDYTINPPSYTDNSNGTVTDNVTGLMWQQEDDNQTYNWYEASGTYDATYNPGTTDVCVGLTTGGHSDWRLPDEFELMGIVDYGRSLPAIDSTAFPNTKSAAYWSTTAWPSIANGGQGTVHSYNDNGDGTVTDNVTGLMWQQEDDNSTHNLEGAITYCENLLVPPSSYSDWRLPNSKELHSIVDNTQKNPAMDSTAFPNTNSSYYWSSTTTEDSTANAWSVYFGSGFVGEYDKAGSVYVRCVRGG